MTPEGKVKAAVKKWLHRHRIFPAAAKEWPLRVGARGWYYMPVQSGMGVHGIPDFILCIDGYFAVIETKAPGNVLTSNQTERQKEIRAATGFWLTVDDVAQMEFLQQHFQLWDNYRG